MIFGGIFTMPVSAVAEGKSPVGYWLARSPFFGDRPLAIVRIATKNKKLHGQIVELITSSGYRVASNRKCAGVDVMYGFYKKGNEWVGGKIYEQKNADYYNSTIKISPDGDHLYVSGWNGPFFRTSVWDRV